MLEPIDALAFSVFENPGVYCLLLGSGVSRSAQIPTGWEITLDLIRRLGAVQGVESDEWESWYRTTYAKEPSYSEIIDGLAPTANERRAILHRYIEPTEQERQDGHKLPRPAHHAIARLVAAGFIRVIVTPNFDRLLENALRDAGVEPTVIASDDSIKGAVPLGHSRCTIVKVHGDYLDTRIRNTESELSAYSNEMNQLLDRIFDEHGLIVCGWSADWDPALRAAMQRSPSRRYPLFWMARTPLTGTAADLVSHRGGRVAIAPDADAFFSQLAEKVIVQSEVQRPNPKSLEVLVATTKRYLSDSKFRIELADLIGNEVSRARLALDDAQFSAHTGFGADEFKRRVDRYEAVGLPLVRIAAALGRWGDEREFLLVAAVLRELAKVKERAGLVVWLSLARYPSMLIAYAYGLGALHLGRLDLVYRLFSMEIDGRSEVRPTLVQELFLAAWEGGKNDFWHNYPGLEKRKTALSDHLFEFFAPFAGDYSVAPGDFEYRLQQFEALASLAYLTLDASPEGLKDTAAGKAWAAWVPVGRTAWHSDRRQVLEELESEAMKKQLLASGFALGDGERYADSLTVIARMMTEISWR